MSITQSERRVFQDIVPWFHEGISLSGSPIDGTGVFASVNISENTHLIRLGGIFLEEARRRDPLVLPSTAVGVGEGILLCEHVLNERDISDRLNHSCDPNAGFLDALTIVSKRPIKSGEEISIDYGYWEGDEQWELRRDCSCKGLNCRTKVSGRDWRQPGLAQDYLRWASPFIRRRISSLNASQETK